MCTVTVLPGQNGCVTLAVTGRVNSDSLSRIDRIIDSGQRRHKRVVLDLSEVTLLDRAAARFFGEVVKRGVALVNCPPYIKHWISPEIIHEDESTEPRG